MNALHELKHSLIEVGPNLYRGVITLSFHLIRENRGTLTFTFIIISSYATYLLKLLNMTYRRSSVFITNFLGLFGFYSNSVKQIFERWRIPVLVNQSSITLRKDDASELERIRLFDSSREAVVARMMKIIMVSRIM